MRPIEFVLWMKGVYDLCGDQPPTPEQWTRIKEGLTQAVGHVVAMKILEQAEHKTLQEQMELEREKLQAHILIEQRKIEAQIAAGYARSIADNPFKNVCDSNDSLAQRLRAVDNAT